MRNDIKTITYVVGDIHGMDNPFVGLLRAMILEAREKRAEPQFVFLGNFTGRGPNSERVFDAILKLMIQHPKSRLVLGDQEQTFLNMLLGKLSARDFARWMYSGGQKTLLSYGIEEPSVDYEHAASSILASYPRHFEALVNAKSYVVEGDYCLVSAGLRPGVAIPDQRPEDLHSIGDAFLRHEGMFEKTVVHGFSQTWHLYPEVFDNRIAINTGAFNCGRLTALAIEEGIATRFLMTKPGYPNEVERYDLDTFRLQLGPSASEAA